MAGDPRGAGCEGGVGSGFSLVPPLVLGPMACVGRASLDAAMAWVQRESRNAGVGRSPTHGGCSQRRASQSRRPFVGRASLDSPMAWAQRRIPERRRRAKPDPRGLFSASRHPEARALRGSSIARLADGLGTATNPGTQASGGARPTGVVLSANASSREDTAWVEHCSTRRGLGHSDESRNAGVGRSPTHGGCSQRRGIQLRGPSWVEHRSTRRGLGHSDESRNAGVGRSPTHGGWAWRLRPSGKRSSLVTPMVSDACFYRPFERGFRNTNKGDSQ